MQNGMSRVGQSVMPGAWMSHGEPRSRMGSFVAAEHVQAGGGPLLWFVPPNPSETPVAGGIRTDPDFLHELTNDLSEQVGTPHLKG